MLPITFISKERAQKMKVWKKIIHANRNKKKAGLALLISNKIDIKTKTKKRVLYNDKIINPEGRNNIENVYAPKKATLRYVKQILKDQNRNFQ